MLINCCKTCFDSSSTSFLVSTSLCFICEYHSIGDIVYGEEERIHNCAEMQAQLENTAKYFLLLESLKLQDEEKITSQSAKKRLESNLNILRRFIKEDVSLVQQQNCKILGIENSALEQNIQDVEQTYVVLLQHVLLLIKNNSNFNSEAKEDLISTRHMNLCIETIQEVAVYALRYQLHADFYGNGVFGALPAQRKAISSHDSIQNLYISIEFFDKILAVKQFHMANSMELVMRDYMAAIYSVFLIKETLSLAVNDVLHKKLQSKLDAIWLHISKLEYFKNLMLFKSFPNLPVQLQKKLHQELLQKLASKDGFTTFVAVLQTATQQRTENGNQQTFGIIADIVAFRGHTQRFQSVMIKQIFAFLDLCIRNEAMIENMGSGLLSLRRLYDLNVENHELIKEFVNESLKKLTQPTDLLSGLIIMEHMEFHQLIKMLYQLFYTSSVECLPSELLIRYIPMLLELYYNLPDSLAQKQQLADIVARCLNNRESNDLQQIVQKLYTRCFDADWKQLHERIVILPNETQTEVCFKIASTDYKSESNISLSLPTLLMQANHAILSYNIFMVLLKLMATDVLDSDQSELDVNLLQSEDELIALLNSKYPVKIEIVLSLNTLISSQQLKAQIYENSQEFLKFMRQLVERRIDNEVPLQNTESTDQILLIMLTLTQELLEHSPIPEEHLDFIPALTRLQTQSPNILVQQRACKLISLLSNDKTASAAIQDTEFNAARALLESHESHLQVYGIQKLLELLRKRDAITMSNGHVIVALALSTLKNKESYTFLNCVRLFVALVNVMEAEVLEILSDEYLNGNSSIDFRLVVGEAILKVSQELGPLCYKYKDVLVNMFMHGARSPIDEFRMSSFANLAQLCRTLCYQVLKFFQELLHLIDCELSFGKYLPAKRAALLVLSDLLEGIDNLMDFEELLLPVYRMLKLIAASETCDAQLHTHATNALKALSEKCKKILFPKEELRKDIRIFGINEDDNRKNGKKHILEIN